MSINAALMIVMMTFCGTGTASHNVEQIGGRDCTGGTHKQPAGAFAVFVFCDDALGTNIAVYYSALGDPRFRKWTLTRRFWQDESWGADVHAIAWVPNHNALVVTTSAIYGTGAVYLLNLETQTARKLETTRDCGSTIETIDDHSVTIETNDCEGGSASKRRVLSFPADALLGEAQPR